jgi:hypothetical protein
MSTATLNVWITNMGDPCSIVNDSGSGIPYRWSVAVSHCNGRVVNWSEGRYRHHHDDKWTAIPYHTPSGGTPGWWYEMIPTRDGHVEIELPPGCYVVRGTMHSWFVHGLLYGNWATERAITQVTCGQDACVTLYAPSAPACSIPLFQFVIPLLVQRQIIGREEGERAIEALKAVFRPEAASAFEREEFETLRRAFEGMENENRRKKEGKS